MLTTALKMRTNVHSGKEFYISYIKYIVDNPLYIVDYTTFRAVINDYFKYLREELIEKGKEIKFPYRMGTLSIVKHKPKEYNGKSLRMDYAESKKHNKVIYHLNEHTGGFKYRFYWNKQTMLTPNKCKYQLTMTRENKRRLAQILKNRERDYIEL